MKVFLLFSILSTTQMACTQDLDTHNSNSDQDLDAKGHCAKKLAAAQFASLQAELQANLKTPFRVSLTKGGGFCDQAQMFILERLSESEYKFTRKSDNHDEKSKTLSADELARVNTSISSLTLENIAPAGCEIAEGESCGEEVEVTADDQIFNYKPANASARLSAHAFLNDDSFKALMKALESVEL